MQTIALNPNRSEKIYMNSINLSKKTAFLCPSLEMSPDNNSRQHHHYHLRLPHCTTNTINCYHGLNQYGFIIAQILRWFQFFSSKNPLSPFLLPFFHLFLCVYFHSHFSLLLHFSWFFTLVHASSRIILLQCVIGESGAQQ